MTPSEIVKRIRDVYPGASGCALSAANVIETMSTALETIAGANLGDCPAAQDEIAHAKAHIAYLRQTAWAAVKQSATV